MGTAPADDGSVRHRRGADATDAHALPQPCPHDVGREGRHALAELGVLEHQVDVGVPGVGSAEGGLVRPRDDEAEEAGSGGDAGPRPSLSRVQVVARAAHRASCSGKRRGWATSAVTACPARQRPKISGSSVPSNRGLSGMAAPDTALPRRRSFLGSGRTRPVWGALRPETWRQTVPDLLSGPIRHEADPCAGRGLVDRRQPRHVDDTARAETVGPMRRMAPPRVVA